MSRLARLVCWLVGHDIPYPRLVHRNDGSSALCTGCARCGKDFSWPVPRMRQAIG
jgi:hypothetical protein